MRSTSIWILAILVCLVLVGWIGHQALIILESSGTADATDYLALLTLVVTIVAGVSGLLGIGSAWFSIRMRKSVEEAVSYSEEFKKVLETRVAQLDACDNLTEVAYGTYRPTGRLLAKSLRQYKPSNELQTHYPHIAREIRHLILFLSREIEHNALMSGQAIRLFSNSKENVKSAAMSLGAHAAEQGTAIIERRRDIEMMKKSPDKEIVSFLSYVIGVFDE